MNRILFFLMCLSVLPSFCQVLPKESEVAEERIIEGNHLTNAVWKGTKYFDSLEVLEGYYCFTDYEYWYFNIDNGVFMDTGSYSLENNVILLNSQSAAPLTQSVEFTILEAIDSLITMKQTSGSYGIHNNPERLTRILEAEGALYYLDSLKKEHYYRTEFFAEWKLDSIVSSNESFKTLTNLNTYVLFGFDHKRDLLVNGIQSIDTIDFELSFLNGAIQVETKFSKEMDSSIIQIHKVLKLNDSNMIVDVSSTYPFSLADTNEGIYYFSKDQIQGESFYLSENETKHGALDQTSYKRQKSNYYMDTYINLIFYLMFLITIIANMDYGWKLKSILKENGYYEPLLGRGNIQQWFNLKELIRSEKDEDIRRQYKNVLNAVIFWSVLLIFFILIWLFVIM